MNRACPKPEKLRSYASGTLPENQVLHVEQHLSLCSECAEATGEFADQPDDFFTLLKESASVRPTAVLSESEFLSAVDLICQRRIGDPGLNPNAGDAKRTIVEDSSVVVPGRKQPDGDSQPLSLGEYDLLSEIGRGSMGVLYRAVHRRLRREVAVKVLKRADTPKFVRRVHREMQAAGRVQHQNVVATSDAGECNGRFFLAMELIDGINLSQLVLKAGPLSVANASEIICQALQGMSAIHQQGLVHRDIKPGNLMLDRSGRVKILDLGLALVKEGSDSGSQLTPSDVVMGSFNYIAPEQIDDAHAVDFKADLYGLGATFYTLLAGRPPFEHQRGAGRLERLLSASIGECPAIETISDDIPLEVATVVSGMMNADRQQRLVDTTCIVDLLQRFRRDADLASLIKSVAT